MRWLGSVIGRALAAPVALLAGSCDEVTEPERGTLEISITTSGGDPDLDGYLLIIDGGKPVAVGLFNTITFEDLPTGPHLVELKGYDANCDLSRAPLRPVTVTANSTTRVEFEVLCYPTGIEVRATTLGPDPDPNGYAVRIGTHAPVTVGPFGTLVRSRLSPGTYTVEVSGLAENCRLEGESIRTAEVTFRSLTTVTFNFVCFATTGFVEVTALTSGVDHDPDGYVAQVGASPAVPLATVARFFGVPSGTHSVVLTGLAPNCRVLDQNPKSIQVKEGGETRDTVRISFDVTCVRAEKIAFERDDLLIYVAYADGSHEVPFATGRDGLSWSPDGTRLAFHQVECSYYHYYYYQYCVDLGLSVINADGTGLLSLTALASDRNPAWSPDGSRIAFERGGQLHWIGAEGDAGGLIPLPVFFAGDPTWSPDGNRLAFTCQVGGNNVDICVTNFDGTGFLRLTRDPAQDHQPAWSPDGSRIAFATTRIGNFDSIALMTPDGTDFVTVTPGMQPAWSPNGARLVFVPPIRGLATINADGTGLAYITLGNDRRPAWRP